MTSLQVAGRVYSTISSCLGLGDHGIDDPAVAIGVSFAVASIDEDAFRSARSVVGHFLHGFARLAGGWPIADVRPASSDDFHRRAVGRWGPGRSHPVTL